MDVCFGLCEFLGICQSHVGFDGFEAGVESWIEVELSVGEGIEDTGGDVLTDFVVGEGFSGPGEVDAVGITACGVRHDTDEGFGRIGAELSSKFCGDDTEVVRRDCGRACVVGGKGSEECEWDSIGGFDEEDRDGAVDFAGLSDFERVIVTWVHGDDIGFTTTEWNATCVTRFHDPSAAVDESVCICSCVPDLRWGSFFVGRDNGLGDPVGKFLCVICLGGGSVCSHSGRGGMRVCRADEDVFGLEGSLIGHEFFGLFDDMSRNGETIDDAYSDRGIGRVI